MRDLTNAEINARLARLAGWKKTADNYWIEPYTPEPRSRVWRSPPDYCSSLDLLRRDVLAMVRKDGVERRMVLAAEQAIKEQHHFTADDWDRDDHQAFLILTAPAETIARAALAALEGESHA